MTKISNDDIKIDTKIPWLSEFLIEAQWYSWEFLEFLKGKFNLCNIELKVWRQNDYT